MTIQKGAKTKLGYRFRCPYPCRKEKSLLKGTFFEQCNVELPKIIEFIYNWANETCTYKNMFREIGISRGPYVAWRSYCRDICIEAIKNLDYQIGGPNQTVQIDESQFSKRKFNRGQVYPQQWVFAGVDSLTDDCFVELVPNRTRQTLLEVIKRRIKPGTTIVSDCWASYQGLELHGYNHLTVNHTYNFVDPDSGAHTQKVESFWFTAKMRNKKECGTKREYLCSYLSEYVWRKRLGSDNPFEMFLESIGEVYKF